MRNTTSSQKAGADRLRYWVAGLSVAAGFVHRIFTSGAQGEQWTYNAVLFGATLFQGVFGLALAVAPWRYDTTGNIRRGGERHARPYYRVGVIGNGIILALYTLTQTVGAPPAAPGPALRLLPDAIEVALIAGFALLLRRSRPGARSGSRGQTIERTPTDKRLSP